MPKSKNKKASSSDDAAVDDKAAGNVKTATSESTPPPADADIDKKDKESSIKDGEAEEEDSGSEPVMTTTAENRTSSDNDNDDDDGANNTTNGKNSGEDAKKEKEAETADASSKALQANSDTIIDATKKETPSKPDDTTSSGGKKEDGGDEGATNNKSKDDATSVQQQQNHPSNNSGNGNDDGPSGKTDTSSTNNNPSRASSNSNPSSAINASACDNAPSSSSSPSPTPAPPTMQSTTTNTNNNNDTNNTNNNTVMDMDFDDDYNSDSKDTLITMTFNQDGGCLAVGTGSGFRICNVNPFQETFRRSLGGGGGLSVEGGGTGIAHIEMLYRTNLLALTGHSTSPQYPPNKVLIYDDHLQRTIGELSFRQKVLTTKLRRDRIVVVLRDRVYIYNFSDLALLDKVHTGDNPLGLIGISMDNGGVGGSTTNNNVERAEDALGGGTSGSGSGTTQTRNNGMVLACPSTQRGQVRVELYGLRRTTFVDAHESQLGALALSVDGSLLATASERGTVIRSFDTRGVTIGAGGTDGISGGTKKPDNASVSSSVPLREFRRGVERATISCLTFSLDSNWLGCASNHGTVHIFQAQDPNGNNNNNNNNNSAGSAKKSRSMTGRAMRMLPKLVSAPKKFLMDGEQSYAQVRGVPHPRACAFVPDKEQTIAVAGVDEYGNGCLLLAEFGKPSSGAHGSTSESKMMMADNNNNNDSEARRLGYHRFFKCKSPASQTGRRRTKSKDNKLDKVVEGGAYIDDAPVDMKMNHISIGDENEDDFVPIDYNEV